MFRRTCKWHHAELSRACEEDALGELDEEEVASATGRAQSLAKEAFGYCALQEAALPQRMKEVPTFRGSIAASTVSALEQSMPPMGSAPSNFLARTLLGCSNRG